MILDRVQYTSLRVVLSLFRTTPTNVIIHLAEEFPLYVRRRLLNERKASKILNPSNFNNIITDVILEKNNQGIISRVAERCYIITAILKIHGQFSDLLKANCTNHLINYNYFSHFKEIIIDVDIGCKLMKRIKAVPEGTALSPSQSNDIFYEYIRDSEYNKHKIFFTDGSLIPGARVGCRIYADHGTIAESCKLCNLLSIFDAEAIAISHALRLIYLNEIYKATIVSDSLSVLSALSALSPPGRSHQLVDNLRDMLSFMHEEGFRIGLVWSPGHIGVKENEAADALASNRVPITPTFQDPTRSSCSQKICFPSFMITQKRKQFGLSGSFPT